VLCTSDGRLQLADFSSAIQLDQKLAPQQSITTISWGTSCYASPGLLKSSQKDLPLAIDDLGYAITPPLGYPKTTEAINQTDCFGGRLDQNRGAKSGNREQITLIISMLQDDLVVLD
jgi:serine/threonine protein kinase